MQVITQPTDAVVEGPWQAPDGNSMNKWWLGLSEEFLASLWLLLMSSSLPLVFLFSCKALLQVNFKSLHKIKNCREVFFLSLSFRKVLFWPQVSGSRTLGREWEAKHTKNKGTEDVLPALRETTGLGVERQYCLPCFTSYLCDFVHVSYSLYRDTALHVFFKRKESHIS